MMWLLQNVPMIQLFCILKYWQKCVCTSIFCIFITYNFLCINSILYEANLADITVFLVQISCHLSRFCFAIIIYLNVVHSYVVIRGRQCQQTVGTENSPQNAKIFFFLLVEFCAILAVQFYIYNCQKHCCGLSDSQLLMFCIFLFFLLI